MSGQQPTPENDFKNNQTTLAITFCSSHQRQKLPLLRFSQKFSQAMKTLSTVVECSDVCSAASSLSEESDPEVDRLRRERCHAYIAGTLDLQERSEPPPPPTWPPTCTMLRRTNAVKGDEPRRDHSPDEPKGYEPTLEQEGDYPTVIPMSPRDMFITIANNCAKASTFNTPPRPSPSPSGPKASHHKKTPSRSVISQKGLIPLRLACSSTIAPSSPAQESPLSHSPDMESTSSPIALSSGSIVHMPSPVISASVPFSSPVGLIALSPVVSVAASVPVSVGPSTPFPTCRESTTTGEVVIEPRLKSKKSWAGSLRSVFRRKSLYNLGIEKEENEDTLVELAPTMPVAATPTKLKKKVSFASFFPGKYEDEDIWPLFRGEEDVRARLIEASLAEKEKKRKVRV